MAELTDDEWREFQAIPDQGYSHRAWVDQKIRERTVAALTEVRSTIGAYTEHGVWAFDQAVMCIERAKETKA